MKANEDSIIYSGSEFDKTWLISTHSNYKKHNAFVHTPAKFNAFRKLEEQLSVERELN